MPTINITGNVYRTLQDCLDLHSWPQLLMLITKANQNCTTLQGCITCASRTDCLHLDSWSLLLLPMTKASFPTKLLSAPRTARAPCKVAKSCVKKGIGLLGLCRVSIQPYNFVDELFRVASVKLNTHISLESLAKLLWSSKPVHGCHISGAGKKNSCKKCTCFKYPCTV